MRALIVGLGSIGRRHLTNLKSVRPDIDVIGWRHVSTHEIVEGVNQVVYRLEEALESQPDFALITCPAAQHIEVGLALAQHGIHLFIEKPLSDDLVGVEQLLTMCRQRNLALMIGYNFRFYRPLQMMAAAIADGYIGRILSLRTEVGQYLPDWRRGTDYRQGVSARRELGGGAVLELSHELDYTRWFGGEVSRVSAQLTQVSDLEIDVEDVAEINLVFANGALGNVHVDMIQRSPTRSCRVIGTDGTVAWDGISNRVQLYTAEAASWSELHPALVLDRNQMYKDELSHFLKCVMGEAQPIVSGTEARRIIEIALAAKQSAREGRQIDL
jgi:predicted dehydrogenase